jgi:hypothetical protein
VLLLLESYLCRLSVNSTLDSPGFDSSGGPCRAAFQLVYCTGTNSSHFPPQSEQDAWQSLIAGAGVLAAVNASPGWRQTEGVHTDMSRRLVQMGLGMAIDPFTVADGQQRAEDGKCPAQSRYIARFYMVRVDPVRFFCTNSSGVVVFRQLMLCPRILICQVRIDSLNSTSMARRSRAEVWKSHRYPSFR